MELLIRLVQSHSSIAEYILVAALVAAVTSMDTPTANSPWWYRTVFRLGHTLVGALKRANKIKGE